MQKCTNGAIWSKTSSAISRLSDASQLATKRPIPALLDSLVWSRFSLPAGDCKQALKRGAPFSGDGRYLAGQTAPVLIQASTSAGLDAAGVAGDCASAAQRYRDR